MKRLAPSEQWDVELFFATKGTPWDQELKKLTTAVFMQCGPVTGDLPTTQQPQQTQTRQTYIRKDVELAKYGYTPGCEGCVAAATNQRPRMHSAECRLALSRR